MTDAGGVPLQHTPISRADLTRRLNEFYWPYHNTLAEIIRTRRDTHGIAFHVSWHSMASIARNVSVDASDL